jgi:hypothetical protein
MAAITQVRRGHSAGRAYYERRIEEGRTKRDAVRAFKRQISNAVFRQLLVDAERVGR